MLFQSFSPLLIVRSHPNVTTRACQHLPTLTKSTVIDTNMFWEKSDRKQSAQKSFHNNGPEIQTAWINKMSHLVLLCGLKMLCAEYRPGWVRSNFCMIWEQQTGRPRWFCVMKFARLFCKWTILGSKKVWIVPFGIGGCPCLILIQARSYIVPIWRYHNAISQEIQDEEEKTFFTGVQNSSNPELGIVTGFAVKDKSWIFCVWDIWLN